MGQYMAQAEPHTSDFIIVGSGINSLVAAALLTGQGHSVCVLERNDWIGGCIKTEELTLPGFRHDVFSGFHPLFVTSPAYASWGKVCTLMVWNMSIRHGPRRRCCRTGASLP